MWKNRKEMHATCMGRALEEEILIERLQGAGTSNDILYLYRLLRLLYLTR